MASILFLFILSVISIVIALDPNIPPFCKICDCTNTNTNEFDVTCSKNVKSYIYNSTYWFDTVNNQSYSYNSLTVLNSPLVVLDTPFPTSSIKILNLAQNSIFNISDNIFQNLQDMEELILSFNNIEILHPDAFKGVYLPGQFMPLKSLRVLQLDHNRIHSLDGDSFEHTAEIEKLSLSHNPLKTLDLQTLTAITSLYYLKHLDLSYTGLASLPDTLLHTPKNLIFLDLSGNQLDHIPRTLGEAHNLETLYMNDNPITNLTGVNGFQNITTLKYLHMRNMKELVNVTEGAFSRLQNLQELYLFDNMKLSYIDKAALSIRLENAKYETWPPIQKLYLQNNKLSYIDMHLILNWKDLKELDLTDNPWTCECENQWMVDELMPVYLQIDEEKAKALRCAAPIEMVQYTLFDIYHKQSTMRCLDLYGHRPERDGSLLVGILAGVLITIPLVLFLIYAYQRNWFGVFDNSPASFSRQFYKRTQSNDEYF